MVCVSLDKFDILEIFLTDCEVGLLFINKHLTLCIKVNSKSMYIKTVQIARSIESNYTR